MGVLRMTETAIRGGIACTQAILDVQMALAQGVYDVLRLFDMFWQALSIKAILRLCVLPVRLLNAVLRDIHDSMRLLALLLELVETAQGTQQERRRHRIDCWLLVLDVAHLDCSRSVRTTFDTERDAQLDLWFPLRWRLRAMVIRIFPSLRTRADDELFGE